MRLWSNGDPSFLWQRPLSAVFGFLRIFPVYFVDMDVLKAVRRKIADSAMLSGGESVLVALSGGPDSVALLHLLCRLRKKLKLDITALYINHQMRPRAARAEEEFCRQLCDRLKVRLLVERHDVPLVAKDSGKGLEEAARDVRYAIFEEMVGKHAFDRVALGHHADDQVETVLFRLFRGTGRSGMAGIPAVRGSYIRPLLSLRKTDILEYLCDNGVGYCDDRSNSSLKFRRNYIRHKLIPAVCENLNPRANEAVLSLVDTFSAEEEYLESVVTRCWRKVVTTSPGEKLNLDLDVLCGYDRWLRRRLLRRCLIGTCPDGKAPARDVVERLDRLAHSSKGAMSLPQSVRASIVSGRLVIYRTEPRSLDVALVPGKRLALDWPHLFFKSMVVSYDGVPTEKQVRSQRVTLDWDKLEAPFAVRLILPGDRFVPLGMRGHKKVGNYLTDRKVCREYRDEIPVVCDNKGIIWLVGHEITERARVDSKTRKVLTIEYGVRKGYSH